MQPPSGTIANLGLALGGLGAGTIAGGWIGHQLAGGAAGDPKGTASTAGAAVGLLATASGGLLLDEFSTKWGKLGRTAALLGLGGITVLAAVTVGKQVLAMRSSSNSTASQLTAGNSKNFTATPADSGRTLTMGVGDTITVALPAAASGQEWQWAIQNGPLVTFSAQTAAQTGPATELDTFTAQAAGQAALQATLVDSAGNQINPPLTYNLVIVAATA